MGLGAGSGSGIAGATSPATIYNPAGLAVSTSTITANVAANRNATVSLSTVNLNSTTPLINIQLNAGTAPDGSGKQMTQFEALINNTGTGYSSNAVAQEALIGVASYWGFANTAFALSTTTTGVSMAVLGW